MSETTRTVLRLICAAVVLFPIAMMVITATMKFGWVFPVALIVVLAAVAGLIWL